MKSIIKILKRLIRRYQIHKAISETEKAWLYEISEHLTSAVFTCDKKINEKRT